MSVKTFENPVFVRAVDGLIEEISGLEDALEFLYQWPKHRRGVIYATALRACQRAFDSDYPLAAARHAFAGFAKSVKILEELSTPMPWMVQKTGQGGGVAT